MNKNLMALAVAGAFAVPATALAQVQIYGRANLGFDRYEATGATAGAAADYKARNRVYDSGSRVGFRGTEDLGGGMRALFSIETGVNIDTGTALGQGGQANTSTGTWGTRDSWVGLEGAGGRVSFGRQSVFWTNGTIAQSGANYINIDVPMATVGGGFGRVAGIGTRINNTVMYTLPTMSGFGGYLSYSPNSEAAAAGANTNAVVEGARVTYEGIVKVQADWAVNKAATGGVNALKITGIKLGVGYPYMPGAQISVIVGQNENNDTAATAGFTALHDTVKQKAVIVNWEHTFGNVQALAMAGKLQKATGCTGTGCDNTEATSFMVGGRYLLSKRTATYLTYNRTTNKDNQTLDYTAAGMTSANPISAGADPKIIALGVIHNF